ncbi:hypothetical protein CDIK_3342, partial [Cucumispora dikerogammari]
SYDESGSQENRAVVFFSELQKRNLLKCTAWTIYLTFESAPSHFYQLVTVHGEFFGNFFSLCFILLSSKNERNYITSFEKLRELTNFHPQTIVIYFEQRFIIV